MGVDELDELLSQLRTFKTDHQTVEAKRAQTRLPDSTHETLSAFANSGGGILLLGVDERDGSFDVTGVASAKRVQADLQSLCSQMTPPLRVTINLLDHPEGQVVVAQIPPVPRELRPCHLASRAAEDSSYIRVGDGDQQISADAVRHMLADNIATDYSAGPAPDDTHLDPASTTALATAIKAEGTRNDGSDDALLRRWRVVGEDGAPTMAGALTVGADPQTTCPAARVTYRVLPRAVDPAGTRFSGRHAEGTVGELLDELTAWLRKDLGQAQVVRDGGVFDVTPIPLEALREVLSNALVHRSFAPGLKDRSVVVEVSSDAVVITSPGNLFTAADPEMLGLSPMSGVRNLALVRIGELLRTPSGARIVENQTSGIEAADRACRADDVMPALFVDRADAFQVLLARGVIDSAPARAAVSTPALTHREEGLRLLAVATRLNDLRNAFPDLAGVVFDAALAARSLAPCSIEVASARLAELERAGLLQRLTTTRRRPVWVPATRPPTPVATDTGGHASTSTPAEAAQTPTAGGRPGRVPDLLAAIDTAHEGVLSAKQIGEALGLASPSSRNRWISRARDKKLIEPTKENPFDPTGGYRLTDQGRHALANSRRPPTSE